MNIFEVADLVRRAKYKCPCGHEDKKAQRTLKKLERGIRAATAGRPKH